MRKRLWGRLGAAVGVVALLAGGLVSVAAPAHADDHGEIFCYESKVFYSEAEAEKAAEEEAYCSLPIVFSHYEVRVIDFYNGEPWKWKWFSYGTTLDIELPERPGRPECGEGETPTWDDGGWECLSGPACDEGEYLDLELGECVSGEPAVGEPVQVAPPPPPCWDASINNCPVGGALRFTAPKYAMVGVPVTMYAYASWRPDANAPSQPTNGTAVIRVDGEDYTGVEFKDGVAEWRFIPETEGMKEFTASGVVFSGLSGANAYIDTAEARTYVLEYDPEAYETALKNKRVEVGDTYVITDPNQARSYLEDRYEWSVSEKSDDVCAVYETKKGAVKAKFNGEGKCTVIWMDKESEEEGKYTFIAKK